MTADASLAQQFGKFRIDASSIFFRSDHSFAFVNLRPIVPGHVLVSSLRVVPRLNELSEEEYTDLWRSVRIVQTILETHMMDACCSAFNVAVQDGVSAGQSVPHVHVHILPRSDGDLERNDEVYDKLEAWEPNDTTTGSANPKKRLHVPEDGDRSDRSAQEMQDEAAIYRKIAQDLS